MGDVESGWNTGEQRDDTYRGRVRPTPHNYACRDTCLDYRFSYWTCDSLKLCNNHHFHIVNYSESQGEENVLNVTRRQRHH